MQTRFRAVSTFEAWWDQLCVAAEMFDFVALTLPLVNRDGTPRILHWRRADRDLDGCETAKAMLPIHQRRSGEPLRAEVEVAAATFLESAGHRIALFSRPVVDHSLALVPDVSHGPPARMTEVGEVAFGSSPSDWPPPRPPRRPATIFAQPASPPGRLAPPQRLPPAVSLRFPRRPSPRCLACRPRVRASRSFTTFCMSTAAPNESSSRFSKSIPMLICSPSSIFFRPVSASLSATTRADQFPAAHAIRPGMHRADLPLMPLAIEQLDVSAYDIVISSSSSPPRGCSPGPPSCTSAIVTLRPALPGTCRTSI